MSWVEIPQSEYQRLAFSAFMKGAGHKYLKRVPAGINPKTGRQRYRYYYNAGHGGGIGNADHFVAGAKHRLRDKNGNEGHYEVVHSKDGKVKLVHDESGHTMELSHADFADRLHAAHGKTSGKTSGAKRKGKTETSVTVKQPAAGLGKTGASGKTGPGKSMHDPSAEVAPRRKSPKYATRITDDKGKTVGIDHHLSPASKELRTYKINWEDGSVPEGAVSSEDHPVHGKTVTYDRPLSLKEQVGLSRVPRSDAEAKSLARKAHARMKPKQRAQFAADHYGSEAEKRGALSRLHGFLNDHGKSHDDWEATEAIADHVAALSGGKPKAKQPAKEPATKPKEPAKPKEDNFDDFDWSGGGAPRGPAAKAEADKPSASGKAEFNPRSAHGGHSAETMEAVHQVAAGVVPSGSAARDARQGGLMVYNKDTGKHELTPAGKKAAEAHRKG